MLDASDIHYDIDGLGITGQLVENNYHSSHFFETENNGNRVKNYQTDLEAISGTLGGDFKFGISPEGRIATFMGKETAMDLEYGGKQIHNVVSGVLELRPVQYGEHSLEAKEMSYQDFDGKKIPFVEVSYENGVHGEIYATRHGIGVAEYTGDDLDTIEDPHLFSRNHESPNSSIHQLKKRSVETGSLTKDGKEIPFESIIYEWGDGWDENRAFALMKLQEEGKHTVLFSYTTLGKAENELITMKETAQVLDKSKQMAKMDYANIMKSQGIDVFGQFLKHLEQVYDRYGSIPQRIRIDGEPTSTWGEQVDQYVIPLQEIREIGKRISENKQRMSADTNLKNIYDVGELKEVMHFFGSFSTFSASLPFDASPQPLHSTDSRIHYTASGGYGGMEWPGRDGAHIAADLAKDGWHRFTSELQLYSDSWSLVDKLASNISDRVGDQGTIPWSWCPWEHFTGTLSYVGIEVAQGLHAASEIASALKMHDKANRWSYQAKQVKERVINELWVENEGYFKREHNDFHLDTSGNLAAIITGFLDLDNDKELTMAEKILDSVENRAQSYGGIMRMEDEYYIGRNPWFVCTGQYVQALEHVAEAQMRHGNKSGAKRNKERAQTYMNHIVEHKYSADTYAEQKCFHQPPRTDNDSDILPLEGWTLLPWSEAEVREAIRRHK